MKPHPVGDLKFVKATHNSPYGLISSEWHRDGNKFDWHIEIPANTTATVYAPFPNVTLVLDGKWSSAVTMPGIKALGIENGCPVFELGSGDYHFTSQ
jgi:alpha-L-rhamnosidase